MQTLNVYKHFKSHKRGEKDGNSSLVRKRHEDKEDIVRNVHISPFNEEIENIKNCEGKRFTPAEEVKTNQGNNFVL